MTAQFPHTTGFTALPSDAPTPAAVSAVGRPLVRAARELPGALARAVAAWQDARRIRAAVLRLDALSAHLVTDIGVAEDDDGDLVLPSADDAPAGGRASAGGRALAGGRR